MNFNDNNKSSTIREFSRFANEYNSYNQIQAQVAKELVGMICEKSYGSILDIGCGTGAVFRGFEEQGVTVDSFVATDGSLAMLDAHPDAANVIKEIFDFNSKSNMKRLQNKNFDLIISSSALQWADDLTMTLSFLAPISQTIIASLFTNNTFKTIHQLTKQPSPIKSSEEFKKSFDKYYYADYKLHSYRLHFDSKASMFKYIKHSGVSGGQKRLNYKSTKELIANYPYDYLEFEVLFVYGKSKILR